MKMLYEALWLHMEQYVEGDHEQYVASHGTQLSG